MALSNDVSFHCIISVLLEFLLYVDNVGLVFVCFWVFFFQIVQAFMLAQKKVESF